MNLEDKQNFFKSVVKYIHKDLKEDALNYFVDGLKERSLSKNEIYIEPTKNHNEIGFIT